VYHLMANPTQCYQILHRMGSAMTSERQVVRVDIASGVAAAALPVVPLKDRLS
jgi:hypothetical protein